MRFRKELSYDAGPDEVYAMLADPAFRDEVCTAGKFIRHHATVEPDGDGMTVEVDQVQPADRVPSFAKKFVGDEIRILQTETWADSSGAELGLVIPGKPGSFTGSITLVESGDGTVETVEGTIKVNIPLLGGKIESLIGDMLDAALRSEERVGRRWLGGGS